MTERIAALVDLDGFLTSFFKPGFIKIYEKKFDWWEAIEEFPVEVEVEKGINAVRESISGAVEALDGCRVFVSLEVSGIPYGILEAAGLTIYEAEGMVEGILDFILKKEEEEAEKREASFSSGEIKGYPVQKETEGNYYLNLKRLQAEAPNISSKKALLPFLQNETFFELEVVCGHVPPWFETEFDKLGLKWKVIKVNENEYKVKICKKTCNEC